MLDKLTLELENKNSLLELVQNEIKNIKEKIITELKNTDEKNYRNEKALYSLKMVSNDIFNEEKFKTEHQDIYNNYLKTKVSFDITNFKKKEKEFVEQYTEKGETSYTLMIKENKIEEPKMQEKEIKKIEL